MYPSVPFARLGLSQYFAQIAVQTPCLIMITRSGKIYLICCKFPYHINNSQFLKQQDNNHKYQQSKIYLTSNSFSLEILFFLDYFSCPNKIVWGNNIFNHTVAPVKKWVANCSGTVIARTLKLVYFS